MHMRWRVSIAAGVVLAIIAVVKLIGAGGEPPQVVGQGEPPRFAGATSAEQRLLIAERTKCLDVLGRLLGAGGELAVRTELSSLPALAGGEALLSFFAEGSRIYRFVQRGSAVKELAPLRSRRAVEQQVIVARDAIEHGSLDGTQHELFERLARLYKTLFAGVERELRGVTHLSISVNGLLRVLPFHALQYRGHAPRSFVGARWALTYIPCAAWRRAPRQPQKAAVIAPAYGNARSVARMLEGATAEISAIAPHFPENAFAQGVNVSAAQLRRALADPYAVVHYVGHGFSDLDDERSQTALVLGGAKEVGVEQLLAHRRFRAPLVVLASCSGAYAARFRDGARKVAKTNVAEALLAGGVGGVVASSWVVKDKQSVRTMRVFYKHLRQLGPAAAMQRAYRHQIARIKPPHPRFWGAYAVYVAARWR